MAVLEQNSGNFSLDDTLALKCVIETVNVVKDHMEYTLRVQRGPIPENNWVICKRYSDFVQLDDALKFSNIDLNLPPKKVFGNMGREFIAARQKGLQDYINRVLLHHKLANSHAVKVFLDPSHYDVKLKERALAQISMTLRSEKKWEILEPMLDIGWRIKKEYFTIKNKEFPKKKFILTWCELGPEMYLVDKDCQALNKAISTLEHPYIQSLEFAVSNEMCGIVIRPFHEKGSLRDLICKVKPRNHFLKKYGKPKTLCKCSYETIKLYGRQVLEALRFLHEKGIPYGHLHAGNILVEGTQQCKLMELENWFLGVPAYLRPFIVQCKKIQTTEEIDVYSFGHLVYEMAMGEQLNQLTCDHVTLDCHPQIRALIQFILSSESLKRGIPSLAEVLENSVFVDVHLPPFEKPSLKLPSKLKENLKQAKATFEKKLKEEQRVWHQTKKMNEAKDFYMSEEERRKRRKSKLKQLSQQVSEDPERAPANSVTSQNGEALSQEAPDVKSAPPPPPPPPPPVIQTEGNQSAVQRQVSCPVDGLEGSGTNLERGALLGSIRQFSKTGLKRANTEDKSAPKI